MRHEIKINEEFQNFDKLFKHQSTYLLFRKKPSLFGDLSDMVSVFMNFDSNN